MKIVKFFYDLETTGTDVRKNGIHQISGMFEVDGVVVETVNFKVAPHSKCIVEPSAMRICKVTEEQIRSYTDMKTIYRELIVILKKYCDKYDAKDKIWLVGFNNRSFDDVFLRAWFEQNGDAFFGSWFWSDSLDVLVLACQYLLNRRREMPSFKLRRVAKELGIHVVETELHDAAYDVDLTRQIYRIITGLEVETGLLL
jgi:DNA polymerase III subunit epsilon